jgi:hypothetical protein
MRTYVVLELPAFLGEMLRFSIKKISCSSFPQAFTLSCPLRDRLHEQPPRRYRRAINEYRIAFKKLWSALGLSTLVLYMEHPKACLRYLYQGSMPLTLRSGQDRSLGVVGPWDCEVFKFPR